MKRSEPLEELKAKLEAEMTNVNCTCEICDNEDRTRIELCEECRSSARLPSIRRQILRLVSFGFDLEYVTCSQIREPLLATMKSNGASPILHGSV